MNRRKLAALSVPTALHVHHEETFHAGIFSLPPGSWMTVDSNGIRQQKYWELTVDAEPAAARRPEEVFEALRDILFQAVECRIDREPVTALLSGGLDSSSIVAIAARCLEKQNRQLIAIGAVLPDESRGQFSDEREYMEEFRSWPNIDIKYVTAQGRGPFDSLKDLSQFIVFPLRSSRRFLVDEFEKVAIGCGSRTLFWGTGGEFGVTNWGQRHYVELAVRLRWLSLIGQLKRRRSRRHVSSIRRLAGEFLNTLFPLRGMGPMIPLAREFQRQYQPKPAWKSRSPYLRHQNAAEIRYWISKHAIERGQATSLTRSATPLFDKRVLEFCLAVPAIMNERDGYSRYLVRGALDGLLPRRIQWRTGKAPFSPDYFVRYNAQLGIARDFVAAIGPGDPVRRVIDVDQVARLLVPADPAKPSAAARDDVPVSLYMINFLRQFPEFRP
ncbi:MAG: asparagine synthase-related protein [Bryobacteraceae bacterium]